MSVAVSHNDVDPMLNYLVFSVKRRLHHARITLYCLCCGKSVQTWPLPGPRLDQLIDAAIKHEEDPALNLRPS